MVNKLKKLKHQQLHKIRH